MTDQGYEFIEGENGLEALDLMVEHAPDVVVCDLNMPTMGGIECMETMRSRGLKFPVIVLTADIQKSTKEKCLNLGAKCIITKPIEGDALSVAVKQVLADKGE